MTGIKLRWKYLFGQISQAQAADFTDLFRKSETRQAIDAGISRDFQLVIRA